MEKIIQFIRDWFQKFTGGQKRRIALVCTAVLVVILIVSVVFSLINSPTQQNSSQLSRSGRYDPIPPQELFLPDEPDFVPGVLLDRERRSIWTEQDASAFWQDPLRHGEEQWREKIETVIDEILENVP